MTRLPAQMQPPITFAHRGARAHARENTLEAFALALRLGATGLESDVWLTKDKVPVLDHDGVVGTWPRRHDIRDLTHAELPDHVPSLEELYGTCGSSMHLSLDIKDVDAASHVVAVAAAAGDGAAERLWLCHPEHQVVTEWRHSFANRDTGVKLVDSTRLRRIKEGPERRAASLAKAGVDAVNLHHSDWTGGLTTLFHRFGVLTFGWDAQLPRVLTELLDLGIDGVYSDHVDRMVDALTIAYP